MTRDVGAAAFIALAALLPRIWLVSSHPELGLFADMVEYFDRARFLFEHGQLYPDAYRVPLYPAALAGAFATFGEGLHAPRVLHTVVFTLMAVATYVLARRAMGIGRALLAGLIVALYPGFLLYTLYVVTEPLFILLALLAILCATYGRRAMAMLGTGALVGLATLTRQAGVGLTAALVLWPWIRSWTAGDDVGGRRRRALLSAAALAGVLVVMTPWTIRNYQTFGRFVPLETSGGVIFLMAYYEGATGRYLLSDWEAVHGRYLNASPEEFSRSALGYRLGLERIASDPIRIVKLLPRRLGYLFDLEGREHLWLYTSSYFGEYSTWRVRAAGWAIVASFPVLALGALASITFGPPPRGHVEWLLLWVLGVMIVQLLTIYGDPRFHLPLVPLLAIVAARPWTSPASSRSRVRVATGTIVIIAALLWWGARLPQQLRLLERAASPDGWQSRLPY